MIVMENNFAIMELKYGNNNLLRLLKQCVVILRKTTTNHITKIHMKKVTPIPERGWERGWRRGRGGERKGEEEGQLVSHFLENRKPRLKRVSTLPIYFCFVKPTWTIVLFIKCRIINLFPFNFPPWFLSPSFGIPWIVFWIAQEIPLVFNHHKILPLWDLAFKRKCLLPRSTRHAYVCFFGNWLSVMSWIDSSKHQRFIDVASLITTLVI